MWTYDESFVSPQKESPAMCVVITYTGSSNTSRRFFQSVSKAGMTEEFCNAMQVQNSSHSIELSRKNVFATNKTWFYNSPSVEITLPFKNISFWKYPQVRTLSRNRVIHGPATLDNTVVTFNLKIDWWSIFWCLENSSLDLSVIFLSILSIKVILWLALSKLLGFSGSSRIWKCWFLSRY